MTRSDSLPALLLSIQNVHAERIFDGAKHFELRKSLPKQEFRRVYLWETGGTGLVGCFDAGPPIRLPIDELWERVGDLATPKERFFNYFKNNRIGCAIPIQSFVRFSRVLTKRELLDVDPTFSVPVSYRLLPANSKLLRTLDAARVNLSKLRHIRLRRIKSAEADTYSDLVTSEIAPKYDEISPAFASSILRTDKLGYDPYGILTESKEVLTIVDENGAVLGFTTLTYKRGGSVKTGPTVLLKNFRHKGFGASVREAIVERVKKRAVRKLYCTCPDNDRNVISYLLRAGYQIEAHLRKQYTERNGELVFGRCLSTPNVEGVDKLSRSQALGSVLDIQKIAKHHVVKFFQKWFSDAWLPISAKIARGMLVGIHRRTQDTPYEEKPASVVVIGRRNSIEGLALIVPKRGGSAKGLLLLASDNEHSIQELLEMAELEAQTANRRKLYFIHPLLDCVVVTVLKEHGYEPEGILRSPYRGGQDAIVLSKFLLR